MNSKPLGLRQIENSSNKDGFFRPVAAGKVVAADVNQPTARGESEIGHDGAGRDVSRPQEGNGERSFFRHKRNSPDDPGLFHGNTWRPGVLFA